MVTRPALQEETLLELRPGWVMGLVGPLGYGLTGLGLAMLATPSKVGLVAMLDVRGWLSPPAAWEYGIDPERLVVVRCPDRRQWTAVTAALLEGLPALYAEVPIGIHERDLRRLAALARARRVALALRPLRGDLPEGVAHLRLRALGVDWGGVERGYGRLQRRQVLLEVSGKGTGGMARQMTWVEDVGENTLRVVSRLATSWDEIPTRVGGAAG